MIRYSPGNCPQCKAPIYGRRKKFCDVKCRNNYHNNRRPQITPVVRSINAKLIRNRHVLSNILGDQVVAKVSRAELTRLRFNFNYFSHTYQSKRGDIYTFCYDYGYLPIPKDQYLVVKAEPETI